jgi:hypothetical protein
VKLVALEWQRKEPRCPQRNRQRRNHVTPEKGKGGTNMSDQPSELHETIERRLLAPSQVALLLDNGSLALMNSSTGMQITLDAAASNSLLDLLFAHKDFLHQCIQPGNQAAQELAEQAHEDWANNE